MRVDTGETSATAERIRLAAIRLWAERGFHGSGIRDLAEAAGLSSATLYHYMGTKEDLLAQIMRQSLDRLNRAAAQLVAEAWTPVERMAGLVQLHVLVHAVRPLETRVGDGEVHALTPAHRVEIVGLRDRYEALWQAAIDAGCASGDFHMAVPGVARLALLEMCSGVAHWYDPEGPLALERLALLHTEMALGLLGMARRPGADFDLVDHCRELIASYWAGIPAS